MYYYIKTYLFLFVNRNNKKLRLTTKIINVTIIMKLLIIEVVKMKLLFIFTGGTIGSTLQNDYISTDNSKPYKLIETYNNKYGLTAAYDIIQPYTELSENNTGQTLKALCNSVIENLNKDYDGIIVTHGTDTLQYSAAALAYTIGNNSIPVCIVSSNYPIEHENANGIDNLHGAVKFIEQSAGNGVWVVYKNPGDNVKVHRGTRLVASLPYSDCFYSLCNSYYGEFDQNSDFIKNPCFYEKQDQISPLSCLGLKETSSAILRLDSYTGMNFPRLSNEIKYILLGSYHSGTINTKSQEAVNFYNQAKELGIKVYLTGVSKGESYESTKLFKNLNIIPLPKSSPVAMYIKMWLCNDSAVDFDSVMSKSLAGDNLD